MTRERYRGALLGLAAGDALGTTKVGPTGPLGLGGSKSEWRLRDESP
jgi:hypothetical protein